jgi:hypothetical protein
MKKSPCRGCPYEYVSKADCMKGCKVIGRVQNLSQQIYDNRTRSDYSCTDSVTFAIPARA